MELGNVHTFDGRFMCDDCFDSCTVTCDNCGERIWRDDAEGDSNVTLSTEEYITNYIQNCKKYKFLILIECDGVLKTRLKNRVHRTIYLEIKQNGYRGLIHNCHYCDRRYKRNNQLITPFELKTIYFDYNMEKVLEIVNNELNCDFTDVIITRNTFSLEKMIFLYAVRYKYRLILHKLKKRRLMCYVRIHRCKE